ncbi:MAG: HAD family hydrolase [Candidatus Thorarchaeota archaeon]|jgi:phosphoglycolate phosphatase-like HAD superfamily hydrolase
MTDHYQCSAIIFDFDGTLADSMPFLEKIGVQVMMKYFDVNKEEATERYQSTTGLPYEHQIKLNFPDNPKNETAIEEFEGLKIKRIFEQKLFSDTGETIKRLHKLGFKLFVSSSTFQSTIVEYFDRRNLTHLFEEIIGYRPGFEKGADHFRHVESQHSLPLDNVVFVGDSLKDFERSKGFCRFIGMNGIFNEADFLKAGHEGSVLSNLSEIPALVTLN